MGLGEISRTILALDRKNRIIADRGKPDYNTLSILPQDNIVLSLFPFASPYQMLSAAVENSRTALFLAVCGIETVVFGIAEVLYLQVRRCFE